MGIEATCDQNDESNEAALRSLFDGSDSFGDFLANPYDNSLKEKDSDLKQYGTGDEFLPSQLLSELLSGSTDSITNKVSC